MTIRRNPNLPKITASAKSDEAVIQGLLADPLVKKAIIAYQQLSASENDAQLLEGNDRSDDQAGSRSIPGSGSRG
jgi:hypothetical protein